MSFLRRWRDRTRPIAPGRARSYPRTSRKDRPGIKRIATFGVVTVSLLLYLSLGPGPKLDGFFRLQEVRVEGCSQVAPAAVVDLLELDDHPNLLFLDLSSLARRALRHPWIREVSFARSLPHTLVVKIEERKPACLLEGPDPVLVSEDGRVLSSPPEGEAASGCGDLPFLRLEEAKAYNPGEKVDCPLFEQDKRELFWRQLPRSVGRSCVSIKEICWGQDGSAILRFGPDLPFLKVKPELLEEQLPRLQTVLRRAHLDWESLEYIDLRFSRKVILKPSGKGGGAIGPG